MLNKSIISKIVILFILISINYLYSLDNTTDEKKATTKSLLITDENYEPTDDLKKPVAVFNVGGSISINSRILFNTFQLNPDGGFEPVPNDRWYGDLTGKIWSRLSFENDRYIHLGVLALAEMERYNDPFKRNSLVPMFNIDELYLNWAYPIGKVIVGRTNYNLKSTLVFNGPLDGVEVNINVPYFDFKSFIGFTGLLGLFNPYFNPYQVNTIDRSYIEQTNLLYSQMTIQLNAEQARRMFFATDFDIHLFGHHINPYFLMQYDFTSLFYNLNREFDVHTFNLGINFEGRIIDNLYYKLNLVGELGMSPTSVKDVTVPIVSCAFETNLRYTLPKAGYLTFVLGYAFGTGNNITKDEWSQSQSDLGLGFWSDKYDAGPSNNKFYYYGKYDGGYVLNPILSNIHSLNLKYIVTPVKRGAFQWSIYNGVYQTIKFWPRAPISDDGCDYEAYMVGAEIDVGTLFNFNSVTSLGMDFGIFIPESAYSNPSPRFKAGASFGVTF